MVFGKSSGWSGTATTLNGTFLNGTNGAELDGAATGIYAGDYIAAGDINGDGKADLLISAPYASPTEGSQAGSVYVYFGKKSGWPTTAFSLGGL